MKTTFKLIRVLFFLVIIFTNCNGNRESNTNNGLTDILTNSFDSNKTICLENKDIPFYEIIKEEKINDSKYSIDIRLTGKLSEGQLRYIAEELKNKLKRNYKKIFIVYYLPNMQIGNGGWATSHFNPNLEVKILGQTSEQVFKLFDEESLDQDKKIIGRWIDNTPYSSCIMTIYSKSDKIFLERLFGDGSSGATEMKAKKINGQKSYVDADGNNFGEYYQIDSYGNLEVFDEQGLIFTAIKKK